MNIEFDKPNLLHELLYFSYGFKVSEKNNINLLLFLFWHTIYQPEYGKKFQIYCAKWSIFHWNKFNLAKPFVRLRPMNQSQLIWFDVIIDAWRFCTYWIWTFNPKYNSTTESVNYEDWGNYLLARQVPIVISNSINLTTFIRWNNSNIAVTFRRIRRNIENNYIWRTNVISNESRHSECLSG